MKNQSTFFFVTEVVVSIEGLGFIKSRVLFIFLCGILDGDDDMECRIAEFFIAFGFFCRCCGFWNIFCLSGGHYG